MHGNSILIIFFARLRQGQRWVMIIEKTMAAGKAVEKKKLPAIPELPIGAVNSCEGTRKHYRTVNGHE